MDRFRRRVPNIIRNKCKAAIATTPVITTPAADPNPVIVIEEFNRIFCTVCANLCFNSGIEDGYWQDWTEFMSLRQSAENGCVGCCLLVQAVRLLYSHDFDGERGKIEWAERRHLPREGKTIPRVWRYSIWDPTFPFAPLHHVFELFTLPGKPYATVNPQLCYMLILIRLKCRRNEVISCPCNISKNIRHF